MTKRKTPDASYVVIDPKMKAGTPCLRGHRLAAEHIAGMYWELGESLESEILTSYDITRADVLACCFYVAEYGSRTWRKRWKAWLDATWAVTGMPKNDGSYRGWWSDAFSDVELPPTRMQTDSERAAP